jgi:2-(1,2-epoxy-1,2-dihydrophenyl)acetyl-CoA isomerase
MGLVPDFGVSSLLPRAVTMAFAMELMLTGRRVDAGKAAQTGLVSQVTDDAPAASLALAEQVASTPADTVNRIKALVRDAGTADHETVLRELEPTAQAAGMSDPRFRERVSSWFIAKSEQPGV